MEKKNCYECQICLEMFSQSLSFKTHIESVHEGKKPFKCSICDYNCSEKGSFTKQIGSVHEEKNHTIVPCVITNVQLSRS